MSVVARESRLVPAAAPNDKDEVDDNWQRLQRSLRHIEKRSRARRIEKIRRMRQQVELLSRVQCVLPLVNDADALWDEFLNEDLKHTRGLLRRLLPAAREIHQLVHERALLTRLVEEHALLVRDVKTRVESKRDGPLDDWKSNGQRWCALARIHFHPWTTEQCAQEIETATNEMNRFILSNDRESTGLSFMGWEDSRRIDPSSSRFQFTLAKEFQGRDLDHYVAASWQLYTEPDVFAPVVLGGRAKQSFEVLQALSPTMWIIRSAMNYDRLPNCYVHCVYLIARIDTDDGVVQFMRSVSVPEIQRAINTPTDVWSFDFYWMRWDMVDSSKPRSSTDFRASLGGTMFAGEMRYIYYWLFEMLGGLVRSEAWATNRQLLQF